MSRPRFGSDVRPTDLGDRRSPLAGPSSRAQAPLGNRLPPQGRTKGPMNGFGYSWLDDHLKQAGLPRPALLSRDGKRGRAELRL